MPPHPEYGRRRPEGTCRAVFAALGLLVLATALAGIEKLRRETAPAIAGEPLEYIERILGGANADEPLPMILAIHGLGSRPENFAGLFSDLDIRARLILPAGPDPYTAGSSWFPLEPSNEMLTGIRRSETLLVDLLRSLRRSRPTIGKPIVTGFSQGGMLSFALAVFHPDEISAAIPVAGALSVNYPPAPSHPPPIRALHGTDDRLIRFDWARQTVAGLREKGWNVELERFEGIGHAIPPAMRDALYDRLRGAVGTLARAERGRL